MKSARSGPAGDENSIPDRLGEAVENRTGAVLHAGETAACLHELVQEQAQRTPEATALISRQERLSYRDLDQRANGLAWRLRALGVRPGLTVALLLERDPDMVATVLAVLKAGCAYLPLDPRYPSERIAFMLQDSRSPVVVAAALRQHLPQHQGETVVIEPDDLTLARRGPSARHSPENLAYVLYTSGSTGRPKPVAIQHRNASALLQWARAEFSQPEMAGVLASTSLSFDLSVFELFAPLSRGGTVILADDLLDLLALPAADQVTLVNTVPSAMSALLETGRLPASVQTVNLAGEVVSRRLVQELYAIPTVRRVLNLYGPSETTVYCTAAELHRDDLGDPPIGRPLAGTRIQLLSDRLETVADGDAGEIFIAGPGVGLGYPGRPELTAERFLPDLSEGAPPGERMYRTADLGRRRLDGELEFLGRRDHQVKVRGVRIEMGEIEALLASHAGLRAAVAAVLSGPGPEMRLAAYVVPVSAESAPSAQELRDFVRQHLPDQMIPASIVTLAELPLTPNGKVDRRALPAPPFEEGPADLPRDPVEEVLTGIFTDLLQAPVARDDDLARSGLHSLLATQALARVRTALGVELPLRAVFKAPTIAGLAAAIRQAFGDGRLAAPPMRRVERRPEGMPLSFGQERLWFLDQLLPGSAVYNIPARYVLEGHFDPSALAVALSGVVRRQEVLRTVFRSETGRPLQLVMPPAQLAIPWVDLGHLSSSSVEIEAERLALQEARLPFDLAAGPLLRARLLRLAPERHWLLINVHHIVADGWSLDILERELLTLYRGGRLPELPFQYVDFASWQTGLLTGERLANLLAYWRQQLAGAPQVLELPIDHPRPLVRSSRGASRNHTLSRHLADRARALSRQRGATLYMTLVAAFAASLSRVTGQQDLLLGTPVANRSDEALEQLIGFFVVTLVLRADLRGSPSFADLLDRIRETTLGAFAHQDLPFEFLVQELQPNRDLGHSPLVQAIFAFERAHQTEHDPALGLSVTQRTLYNEIAMFDLVLTVTDDGRQLHLRLEHAADLIDPATAVRWLSLLETLLAGALASPLTSVAELPVLTEAAHWQVVAEWNLTDGEVPGEPVHRLFQLQAAVRPDAVAVTDGDRALTYRELDLRASRLAHRLRRLGVRAESVVGLCLEQSAELVIAALAVLKADGAFLPLAPWLPAMRLESIVEDAGVRLLVSDRRQLPASAMASGRWAGAELVLVESDPTSGLAGAADLENELRRATPSGGELQLAYVIYTSGSTGRPKGVEVTHRGLSNLAAWHRRQYAITPADRATLIASPSFDASVWEIWPYLSAGASLQVVPDEVRLSPGELGAFLDERQITVCFVVTSLAELMLAEPLPDRLPLRSMLTGGEFLRVRPNTGTSFTLFNHYGPTESTVVTTAGAVAPEGGSAPFLGRPIANTRVYLLDGALRPVPVGVAGEIHIAGRALARGYRGGPALTAARFLPDPFGGEPGGRLYRTGDLARWSARGEIEFLGRLDAQVKIRAFRIEPAEISSALLSHPGVREAVVVARNDPSGSRHLVAYFVSDNTERANPDALRSWLAARLPDYMVPAVFVQLPALPLTPNGKLDRAALPAPDTARFRSTSYVAPQTPTEEAIASIWCEVLGVDKVGRSDDFFDLGGHSLLAIRVIARCNGHFGLDLAARSLFEARDVRRFARLVDRQRAAQPARTPEIATSAGEGQPQPATVWQGPRLVLPSETQASPAQERFWFLEDLGGQEAPYNVPFTLRLAPSADVRALRMALCEIVRRHEVLRASFMLSRDTLLQRVMPETAVPLPCIDLRRLERGSPAALAREIGWLERTEAIRRFELSRGPLLRAQLLLLGDERRLLLTLHHITCDAESIDILIDEIETLHAAFEGGRTSPLPELSYQYADFAAWQRRRLGSPALVRQLEYWRARLAGAPAVVTLPTDRLRPTDLAFRGGRITRPLQPATLAGLRALSKQENATVFMALLAILNALLQRYCGHDDLVVGTPFTGRTWPKADGLIGPFLNTVVVRSDLSGVPSFATALGRVRDAALGAYDHSDLPFAELVDALRPERRLSQTPLFQVLLLYQEAKQPSLSDHNRVVRELCWNSVGAKFDLTLSFLERDGSVLCEAEYNRCLFDGATIRRFLDHFWALTEALLRHPGLPVRDLALLSPVERHLLQVESNDTWTDIQELPIHEQIQRQARLTPENIAVLSGDEALTYRELADQASDLARRLAARGIGLETPVALLLERAPRLVVAVAAILEAGGAYVPLDPEAPSPRVGAILDSLGTAGGPFLLTESRLIDRVPEGSRPPLARLITIDREAELPSPGGGEPLAVPVSLTNAMYILHTSGSSGIPKAVAVTHGSVATLLQWARDFYTPAERSVVLASTRLTADLSVFELFVPLTTGGCAVLVKDILALLARESSVAGQATLVNTVPSLLADVLEAEDQGLLLFASTVNLAGETLRRSLAVRVHELGSVHKVVNLYGPTEATVYATASTVQPGDTAEPTIGRPVTGSRAYIVDDRLELQPIGIAGELMLGGVGLARGYWQRPDLTADSFRPDPFGCRGARMYRTGDRARLLADGRIEFLGRLDRQLKVRGIRIDPEEIEMHLAYHPAVDRAAVTAADDPRGDRHLIAYVVPRCGPGTLDRTLLRSELGRSLPAHLIPTIFVELRAMPATTTGKVNLAALPPPPWEIVSFPAAFVPPRPGIEQRLARLWKTVLPVPQVGVNDDFFDQGGNSLKAMRLKGLIEDEMGIELQVARIFQHPQLGPLAAEIGELTAANDAEPVQDPASWPPAEIGAAPVAAPLAVETEDLLADLLREKARALARRTTLDFPAVCTVARAAELRFQVLVESPVDSMLHRMLRQPFAQALAHESLLIKVTAPGFHLVRDRARFSLPLAEDSEEVRFRLVPLARGRHLIEVEVFAEADRVAYLTLESQAIEADPTAYITVESEAMLDVN